MYSLKYFLNFMYAYIYTYIFTKFLLKFAHFLQHYLHFNSMIRKIYPKCFDFTLVSQEDINNKINKINGIYRESLNIKLAFEVYNNLCQINLGTLI